MAINWKSLASTVVKGAIKAAAKKQPSSSSAEPVPSPPRRSTSPAGRHLGYSPDLDGKADPGEVVWTWVEYEEDSSQGKDRPVLVVGREGSTLLGLMLTSKDHGGQRGYLGLGPGAWDREERPSWVRLDRVLEVPEDGIRREGAVLARDRFDRVAAALRNGHGWL